MESLNLNFKSVRANIAPPYTKNRENNLAGETWETHCFIKWHNSYACELVLHTEKSRFADLHGFVYYIKTNDRQTNTKIAKQCFKKYERDQIIFNVKNQMLSSY